MADTKNLRIWDEVERTDEAYTKPFTIPFKGTAINPDYLFKKATRVFGPAGKGWGYEITGEQILETIPIFNDQGEQIAMEKVHTLDVMLWYMQGNERHQIPGRGHTRFIYKGANRIVVDPEYGKKSVTDALTKALSFLGFGGDIRMGMFEQVDYLQEQRETAELESAEDKAAKKAEQLEEFAKFYKVALETIAACKTGIALQNTKTRFEPRIIRLGTEKQKEHFAEAVTAQAQKIVAEKKENK